MRGRVNDNNNIIKYLDVSEYPNNHPIFAGEGVSSAATDVAMKENEINKIKNKNKKVIGKFKDELLGEIMRAIAFSRAKQYSFIVHPSERLEQLKKEKKLILSDTNEMKKLKGLISAVVKKEITFNDFVERIKTNAEPLYKKMVIIRAVLHEMYVMELTKKALAPYDDKRYICNDGITTYPIGVEDIIGDESIEYRKAYCKDVVENHLVKKIQTLNY
jgi:hypothetical protein